jgi:hypothetical protein
MTHPDALSGQPYAPPPWDPNRLPPPSPPSVPNPVFGGDGGGGGKKHRKWPWILAGVAALAVSAGVAAGNSADPAPKVALPTATQAPYPTLPPEQKAANAKASTAAKAPPAPTAIPPVTAKPRPAPPPLTTAQAQAIGAAKDYLGFDHFSRTGLIRQLEFDKYTRADAAYAVDHITVNWNEQGAGAAKDYLSFDHFSRAGLIEQLVFDGFTRAQAVYAANKVGL